MSLSNDVISQFAKTVNGKNKEKTESTVYGTVAIYGGQRYVKMDGSDLLTPCDTTVSANEGERVTVLVKNHTATINGNLSSPSARTGDVEVVREQVLEVQRVVADKATIKDLEAERARIEELVADNAVIKGRVSASEADIGELKTNNAKITGRLDANEASIKKLDAEKLTAKDAELKYATVEKLQATDAKVGNLETDNVSVKGRLNAAEGNIKNLNADNVAINKHLSANDADIKSLRAEKLNAKDADIKYANIDFSNIGIAAMEKFYSESGLIKNVVVGDQTITGELVGVTIRGDLIEGNTIKADKLVIKGEDGLYYKLNTNGSTITSEQTDYNSLNGTLIQAKSITADKVAVTDLVAFGADIAGNHIGNGAIYSGVKTSALNTTKGFYLGSDGQVGIGDTNHYIQFYKGDNGEFHLRISAEDILFGKSKKTIESAISEIDTKVNNVKSIVGKTYTYQIGTNMTDVPTGGWGNWNDAYSLASSADMGIANWCYNNDRTYINGGRLYAGTVTATQLAADSVTADKIGAAAVTSEKIAALSVTAAKIDVADLFAQNITATGTISGLTLTSADVVAKRIIATKEISLSCKNTADVERVLYYDGTSVRVGKLLNAAGAQSGAGFEFFDKTITMYGSLNLYSGDITTTGKVQGKTITATVDMNTNTIYASNWFRSRGTTGWYSEDYGGGWYMTDSDWIRAYNGKGITTNGNMSIGGYIQSNNIINTTYEYQSNRGSVDWRFGAATGTGDENFFSFYKANNGMIPLAIDGNFGNIYVGFNVGGSGSKTAVGIYLGAQVAGNRAFIYHGDSYAGSIWIQTRLDGSWKWFSLGRVCSTALSDIRLKGNIRDTEVENATKVIESMKIHSFERKDSHKKYKIGFIADELEQLDPNLVDGGGEVDGHPYYKSVNNLQMLAYVVKSMQELNQRVSELEKENENEKLKRKLNLN